MRKCWLICIVVILHSCAIQKQQNIYRGGVFVSDLSMKNRGLDYDSIFPILALRIDIRKQDTLFIKYRLGREALVDIDAAYSLNCNCYISTMEAPFAPYGGQRARINIYILPEDKLKITFTEDGAVKEYYYTLTYIDKVNLKRHRDVYYAEEGFKLFKE